MSGYKQGLKSCAVWLVSIALVISIFMLCINRNPLEFHKYIEEISGHQTEDYAIKCGKGQGFFTKYNGRYYFVEMYEISDREVSSDA